MGKDAIVLERHLHQPLHVDAEGLLLLLHAREGLSLGSVSVGGRNEEVRGGLLLALSCLANQTPERGLELQVFSLTVDTRGRRPGFDPALGWLWGLNCGPP